LGYRYVPLFRDTFSLPSRKLLLSSLEISANFRAPFEETRRTTGTILGKQCKFINKSKGYTKMFNGLANSLKSVLSFAELYV